MDVYAFDEAVTPFSLMDQFLASEIDSSACGFKGVAWERVQGWDKSQQPSLLDATWTEVRIEPEA